jgi:hypothetical protein
MPVDTIIRRFHLRLRSFRYAAAAFTKKPFHSTPTFPIKITDKPLSLWVEAFLFLLA